MKKLKSIRAESLTETLAAILVIALAALMLAVAADSASRLTDTMRTADEAYYEEITAAEEGAEASVGSVLIEAGGWSEEVPVTVYGADGALRAYREVTP